jgi:2-desacetyl-2-hydroxyethyl bacteriochlorophyllide A dehydrogenase
MTPDKLAVRTAFLAAPGKLEFRTEELATGGLGPRDIVAVTRTSVISPGTEVGAFAGLPPLRPGVTYPRLVGYCNLAEVIAAGPEVKQAAVGKRILTFESHRSAFRAAEDTVIAVVSDDVKPHRAAATYLYHLGYAALLRADFKPGETVAVVGLGTLGLATAAVAAAAGASVIALGDQAAARERSLAAGARVAHPKRDVERAIADASTMGARAGIDIVVTTSNSWDDWDLALRLPRKGGTIAVLGFPGREGGSPARNPLASALFYDHHLRIVAAGYTPDLEAAPQDVRFTIKRNCTYLLDLIVRGRLDPDLLVTHTRPWHELGAVYQQLAARAPGLVTCALDWTEGTAP